MSAARLFIRHIDGAPIESMSDDHVVAFVGPLQ
jgi:hypothetical protein